MTILNIYIRGWPIQQLKQLQRVIDTIVLFSEHWLHFPNKKKYLVVTIVL